MTADSSASASFLICRSGARLCALPLEHVAETMRVLPIDPLPGMPFFLLGISMVRGAVVPVVDVAQLVGGTGSTRPSRFVTVRAGDRQVALAVEIVVGVRVLDVASMEEIPLLFHEVDSHSIAAIGTLDAELLLVLQSARLVPESVWEILDGQVLQP